MKKLTLTLVVGAIVFPLGQFIYQAIRPQIMGEPSDWENAISCSVAQIFVLVYVWLRTR